MTRRKLDAAKDLGRILQPINDLAPLTNATENDIFFILDTNEIFQDAQPKNITLSGMVNSMRSLPVFANAVSALKQYGSFYDTTTQTNSGANIVNYMRFNETEVVAGITSVSGSRILLPISGVYNFQFSAQVIKTDSGTDDIDIWFIQNNTAIPWSNTRQTVTGSNGKVVAAWNYFIQGDSGDNIQIAWSSADSNIQLLAASGLTNPVRPATPSIILTVNEVS